MPRYGAGGSPSVSVPEDKIVVRATAESDRRHNCAHPWGRDYARESATIDGLAPRAGSGSERVAGAGRLTRLTGSPPRRDLRARLVARPAPASPVASAGLAVQRSLTLWAVFTPRSEPITVNRGFVPTAIPEFRDARFVVMSQLSVFMCTRSAREGHPRIPGCPSSIRRFYNLRYEVVHLGKHAITGRAAGGRWHT